MTKRIGIGIICIAALLAIFSHTTLGILKVVCPYPRDYVKRLQWLKGAPTEGIIPIDCGGFIANAKGIRAPWGAVSYFDLPRSMGASKGKPTSPRLLVTTYASKADINESALLPGDMAQFTDDNGEAVHVIAFLRPGLWIDADYRRGNVAEFALSSKPSSDPWFSGHVRILRWKA